MKKTTLLFLVTIYSSLLNARTIKIISKHCDDLAPPRIGSGFIVKIKDKKYVLTSDHVIYHGNIEQSVCHSGLSESGANLKLELLDVNIGLGLALMSVDSDSILRYFDLNQFTERESLVNGDELFIEAFPYSSLNLAKSSGEIFQLKSDRHLLPQVKSMLELDIHTEFGMSGGPVIDRKSRKLAGMLSHQVLREELGKTPVVDDLNDNTSSQGLMLGLVIPAYQINEWVMAVISGDVTQSSWQNVNDQFLNKESIIIDGLIFKIENCQKNTTRVLTRANLSLPENFNTNIVNISSLSLFSGGDGAGVGGSRSEETREKCDLSVKWVDNNSSLVHENSEWTFSNYSWFTTLKRKLKTPEHKAVFKLLVTHDGKFFDISKDLVDFFSFIEAGNRPTGRISSPLQETSKIELEVLKTLSTIDSFYREIEERVRSYDTVHRISFVKKLENLSKFSQNDVSSFEYILDSDLESIYESKVWDYVFSDFDLDIIEMAEFRGLVSKLRDQLNSLRI